MNKPSFNIDYEDIIQILGHKNEIRIKYQDKYDQKEYPLSFEAEEAREIIEDVLSCAICRIYENTEVFYAFCFMRDYNLDKMRVKHIIDP